MKIHYVSDLHLDVGYGGVDLPGGDILLIAGDLTEVRNIRETKWMTHAIWKQFLDEAKKYKKCYYIMGNHEYYHHIYKTPAMAEMLVALKETNIQLLDNEVVQLGPGWYLLAGTLWTDYKLGNPVAMMIAQQYMNDHHVIKTETYRKFLPTDAHADNLRTKNWLKKQVEALKDKNLIVMSHQSPSFQSCAPRWRITGDINFAYHNSDLDQWIMDSPQIKYWLHGHTHDSLDYLLGTCRVLCNPRGYGDENEAFDINKHFEVTLNDPS